MDQTFDNAMRRQVYSIPELITQQYDLMEPRIREALSFQEIFSLQHIIITGCGDSMAAAMAVKQAFEQLTKMPIEVLPAVDVARFYPAKRCGGAPNDPLVITVSNSGKVSRVQEAIMRMNELGALTLGITSGRATPLGQVCQKVIDSSIPKFESAPGVRGFLASFQALLLMAIRIGEVKGRYTMDQAKAYRMDVKHSAEKLAAALPAMDEKVYSIAQKWKDFPGFDFVGAGTDYASAWYSHAKMIEAAGRYSMHINTEEFLHLDFFLENCEHTGTVAFIDDANASMGRMKETLHYMQVMERPLMVVTDADGLDVPEDALVKIPQTEYEITSPIMSFIPGALLAGYISAFSGEPYSRGFRTHWQFAKDASAIHKSQIEIVK